MSPESILDPAQLAAGIGHDLRNVVLFPLSARVDLAQRALRNNDVARANALLEEMIEILGHGESIIERLSRRGSKSDSDPWPLVEAHALALRAIELVRARSDDERLVLVVEARAAGSFAVDPEEVIAALVNVIANAMDALAPTGGTITVRTGRDREHVWFEISDDGPGIAPDIRARLFEPFVSSKGEQSTGIGLAMVDDCMRRYGGAIDVESDERGSRFTFRFPIAR